ncbi:MAG: hypothetical protein ACRDGQ_03465 [Candidatus Limnocylindrales bacterium]
MDRTRIDLLSVLARDASLERSDYLVQATEQFQRFLDANASTIREIGGLTLIDDDPDYLAVAPDLSFRSRSRYLDDATGEWHSETEIVESAAEIVELYSPAELYTAFTDSARAAAGLAVEGDEAEGTGEAGDSEAEEDGPEGRPGRHGAARDNGSHLKVDAHGDPYVAAADSWAASQDDSPVAGEQDAARRLYDLALSYQERSQRSEADLVERFQVAAGRYATELGELLVVESDEERLVLQATGTFRAEVEAEDEADDGEHAGDTSAPGDWLVLATPEELVGFYDPTDVFGDLADALAEAFPSVAPAVTADGSVDEHGAADADEDADRG